MSTLVTLLAAKRPKSCDKDEETMREAEGMQLEARGGLLQYKIRVETVEEEDEDASGNNTFKLEVRVETMQKEDKEE